MFCVYLVTTRVFLNQHFFTIYLFSIYGRCINSYVIIIIIILFVYVDQQHQ